MTEVPSLGSPVRLDPPSQDWNPIIVPKLRAVPVKVMGHSWTVTPASWHKTGNHWTNILENAGKTGTLTNIGVGGTTMEWWAAVIDANPAGAYAGWVWDRTVTDKRCALMMNVLNSAKTIDNGLQYSLDSFEKCARTCAATVLSDRLNWAATGIAYEASWSSVAGSQAYSGTWIYKTVNTAKMTYTSPVDHDYLWLCTLAATQASGAVLATSTYRIQVDGETVYEEGRIKIDSLSPGTDTFSKVVVPIGPVAAGQVVTWEKVDGPEDANNAIWFDGFMSLNAKHHIAFTKDPKNINSATYPEFSVDRIVAHNAVLDSIKSEFNAIAPNLVTLLDLEDISTFDASTMLWSGDTVHPNDKGQPWVAAQVIEQLNENLPYTTRLDTL